MACVFVHQAVHGAGPAVERVPLVLVFRVFSLKRCCSLFVIRDGFNLLEVVHMRTIITDQPVIGLLKDRINFCSPEIVGGLHLFPFIVYLKEGLLLCIFATDSYQIFHVRGNSKFLLPQQRFVVRLGLLRIICDPVVFTLCGKVPYQFRRVVFEEYLFPRSLILLKDASRNRLNDDVV